MSKRTLALFVMLGLVVGAARAEIIEQVLVKVNGEIITKTDLERRQVIALRQRNQDFASADLQDDQLKKALLDVTPQVIVDAVDELLLVQRSKELGYKLSDSEFQRILDNIKKENKIQTDEQFQAALKQEGMTMADLRNSLERQMHIQRVEQTDVLGKMSITEEEAQKYYGEHEAEFSTPAAVTLREILVSVPNDGKTLSVGLDEEAEQKAGALRARIVGGEAFEKVAAEASDAASRANGGLVGPINRSELAPALQQLLDRMKVGETSPVLRTSSGYQIITLESLLPEVVMAFEQARDQISERLFEEKRRGEMAKYLRKLRSEAIIEWKNDEIKKAYDHGLAAAPPGAP